MKHVYNYSNETFELTGEEMADLDPEESKMKGRNVFLLPANATFVEPPVEVENKIQVFNTGKQKWSQRSDFRGSVHYSPTGEMTEIKDIGRKIPKTHTLKAPPQDKFKENLWDGKKWKEGALIFRDRKANDKKTVNKIITKEIAALGEEKIKTQYLIALGKGEECPEWDAFLEARQALLDEANTFIKKNELG
jgi:hypothetical protein